MSKSEKIMFAAYVIVFAVTTYVFLKHDSALAIVIALLTL